MKDNSPFMALPQSCDEAVDWITGRLMQAGLSVLRTFDLRSALGDQPMCLCPNHGADLCDCQMVVLLVYRGNYQPLAVTAQGYDHQTWFSFVDNPQQRADPHLEGVIRGLINSRDFPSNAFENDTQSI